MHLVQWDSEKKNSSKRYTIVVSIAVFEHVYSH